MSYGDFTLGSAIQRLHIHWILQKEKSDLYKELSQEFTQEKTFCPSSVFQVEFTFGLEEYESTAEHSESMLNNHFMRPLIWEVWRQHRTLRIWTEIKLNADPAQDLVGTPDYCVTHKSYTPQAPYCIIMEAKKENFEQGWGQALAAMKGAQLLNKREASLEIPIYGVVSNGILWHFGKLTGDNFLLFPTGFISIFESGNHLKVLTLLDIIFSQCEMIDQSKSSQNELKSRL